MNNKLGQKKFFHSSSTIFVFLVVFTFILYGHTLHHKYCLDDAVVITQNTYTQQGISGIKDIFTTESFTGFFGQQKNLVSGSRYRPLSIATFAVEQQFFHGSPGISHFINLVLYVFTCFFIYLILKKIVVAKSELSLYLPAFAAILFLFHPIHTEVVANIKGRDEILGLLLSLIGCYGIILYMETGKKILLFFGSFFWFLALFSKENAIVFLVIMPMILYSMGFKELKKIALPAGIFALVSLIYLVIRHSVIGGLHSEVSNELMNNSYLHASQTEKYATISYTLFEYVKLLVFPHPLTYDYYPYQISLVTWSCIQSILGLFIYLIMVVFAFYALAKKPLWTLGIAIYILPLLPVSNIFFPIGTMMSERFIYYSSVGFCGMLAYGFVMLLNRLSSVKFVTYTVLFVFLVLYGYKTIDRNKAWSSDYTLFTTDVKTSGNSAKSNCSAGGILFESLDTIQNRVRKDKIAQQSINYLKKAIAIHPIYNDAWLLLGNAYLVSGNLIDSSINCYIHILKNSPNHDLAIKNMFVALNREKNTDKKISLLDTLVYFSPNNFDANYKLGKLWGKEKNDLERAIYYLSKALTANPQSKDVYIDLGVAYGMKKDFKQSAEMLEKALLLSPNEPNIYMNLGITYQNLGNFAKANELFKKARELKH